MAYQLPNAFKNLKKKKKKYKLTCPNPNNPTIF